MFLVSLIGKEYVHPNAGQLRVRSCCYFLLLITTTKIKILVIQITITSHLYRELNLAPVILYSSVLFYTNIYISILQLAIVVPRCQSTIQQKL